jgi:hypothetical protein
MLSSAERPLRSTQPPVLTSNTLRHYGSSFFFPVDIVTITQFPHRAPHVKLDQGVKPAANLVSTSSVTNDSRIKRIMREVCLPCSDELHFPI